MHTAELVELAALVAAHAPRLIHVGHRLPPDALAQYWSASKCRQQRWARSLKGLATGGERLDRGVRPVLQEILASEALTRVWAAALAAHDRRRGAGDAEPVARSVFVGHLEARNRALTLLARQRGISSHDAGGLNRLRRQVERWNDMLIGSLLVCEDVAEFAFDAELAREFAEDFRQQPAWEQGGAAWSMARASLGAGFCSRAGGSRNGDLNVQIGAAVVGCFEPDLFDFTALPQSLWSARLSQAADRAEEMIEQLFLAERTPLYCAGEYMP